MRNSELSGVGRTYFLVLISLQLLSTQLVSVRSLFFMLNPKSACFSVSDGVNVVLRPEGKINLG